MSSAAPAGRDESLHRGARRASARQPMHGSVRMTAPVQAEGFLFNASAGGLRLALNQPVEVGATVELQVHLSGDTWAEDRAEVVWCRELPDGWLVGVRFVF